jgi:hypothetical protein
MFLGNVHRLTAVRSFKYDGFTLQLFQDGVQRLANQCVIVDNENFHKELPPSFSIAWRSARSRVLARPVC